MKRYQVRFRDTSTGGMLPDDPLCWFDCLTEAEGFAVMSAAIALDEGELWEASIFKDGKLHHQHGVPVAVGC